MGYVSVLVPHKNSPKKLFRLLQSIPNSIPVIVVDDGSTFNDVALLHDEIKKKYKNVTLIENDMDTKNAGVARNLALENCKTQWVIFADADDEFKKEELEKIVKYLEECKCDIVYFGCKALKEDFTESRRCDKINLIIEGWPNNKDVFNFLWVVPWGRAIQSEFIKKNNIKFSSRIASNDVEFSAKLAASNPFFHVKKNTAYICYESLSSLTGSLSSEKAFDRLQAGIERNKIFRENNVPLYYQYNLFFFIKAIPEIIKKNNFSLVYDFICELFLAGYFNLINKYLKKMY